MGDEMTLYEFIEEKDKALETNNVNTFIEFIGKAVLGGVLTVRAYQQFMDADETERTTMLHKLAMTATGVSKERKAVAREWLTARGIDYRL